MKNQVRTALAFFFIAAVVGWLLRAVQSGWLLLHFKYLLHTHSHVALIGWVYNGCFLLLQHTILAGKSDSSWYRRLFWLTQITILGMLFSFPVQGYGAISITFSTLYIFASYALGCKIYRDISTASPPVVIAVRASVIFLMMSSLGPFALGYFMSQGMGDSIYYKLSIYWFLHFLYNGFFLLTLVAYGLRYFPPPAHQGAITWSIVISTLALFFLSALWTGPDAWRYVISFLGSIVQLLAFGYWALTIPWRLTGHRISSSAAVLAMVAFFLKLIFQVAASLPVIQVFINDTVPYAVIGFIHLVMLGFFSLGLLVIFIKHRLLAFNMVLIAGLALLMVGIFLSEIMLFTQAIMVSVGYLFFEQFFQQLSVVSTLLPIGILLLLISQFIPGQKQH